VQPSALFRLLSRAPVPREVVEWRGCRIEVVALPPQDVAELRDMTPGERVVELVVRACRLDSADDLAQLPGPEFDALCAAVSAAFVRCCPPYSDATVRELQRVALDGDNWRIADLMFTSLDRHLGIGGEVFSERPDRYYGKPTCSLTDGQVMAYRAACAAVLERRRQSQPSR
jgi:hypothetical protein